MKVRELYNILFTEYPGHLGFAPAVITIAIGLAVCGSLAYGGFTLGKAVIAGAPAVETGHS
jgi:hypothetical protein